LKAQARAGKKSINQWFLTFSLSRPPLRSRALFQDRSDIKYVVKTDVQYLLANLLIKFYMFKNA